MSESPNPVEAIFLEVIEQSADSQPAFLQERCAGDEELIRQVSELLAAHNQTGSFVVDRRPAWQAQSDPVDCDGKIGLKIDQYTIREKIGEGGMGVVYVAEQESPIRRKVALKIIKPGMDTKSVLARFEAEQQALAIMNHRHIAKVLDAGLEDSSERPYFVMELVSGIPVTQYCDEKQLTVEERLELFVSVCRAIQHAHQKGIIHRDIKPSNVLVAEEDGQAIPKVIDFGVAKALNQKLTDRTLYTNFQAFLGTPLYASPEQASLSNVDVDTRSDVYSLGVLLYELLTGTTPHDKEKLQEAAYEEMCRIIREQEPVKPSTKLSTLGERGAEISNRRRSDPMKLAKDVRGDLDWIVMKAIEKDRARRYEGASSLAADISRLLNNEAIEARPPSTAYLLSKLMRRYAAPLATSGVLILGITSLLGVGLYRERNFSQQLIREREQLQSLLADYEADLTEQALLHAVNGDLTRARDTAARLEEVVHSQSTAPAPVANAQFIEGVALFFGGQEASANKKLTSALIASPKNYAILAMTALCQHFVVGDVEYENRLKELDGLPPTDDPHALLFHGFAELYRDPLRARELVDSVVQRSPSTLAHAIRTGVYGHLTLHTGLHDEYFPVCLESSRQATLVAPNNAFVMLVEMWANQIGQIVTEREGNEQALIEFQENAERSARAMVKLHPKYRLGRLLLAAHYLQQDQRDEAGRVYLELASERNWLESLAPVVYETENATRARETFESLDEPIPNSQVAMAYLMANQDLQSSVDYCWAEFRNFPSQGSAVRAAYALLFLGELYEAKRLASEALSNLRHFPRPYKTGFERLQFIVDEDLPRFQRSLGNTSLSDTNAQAIAFTQGMVALAKGDPASAAQHFGTSVKKEPFPDSEERYWAVRFLENWQADPTWLPPGPRNGDRGRNDG